MHSEPGEASAEVAARVNEARTIAASRGVATNADIPGSQLDNIAPLEPPASRMLADALRKGRLTARGYTRIRRVARTIADLQEHPPQAPLNAEQVALAMALRSASDAWSAVAA